MSKKIYPIGIQNFEKIRRDGYFYVDKTALVYRLAKSGSYFVEGVSEDEFQSERCST